MGRKFSMKRIITFTVAFSLLTFCVSVSGVAQTGGIGGFTGGGTGNTGGTGSSGNYTGGGSSGTGSSSSGSSGSSSLSSTGMDNSASELTSTQDAPTFQGFDSLGTSNFVGIPNSSSFIGTEQTFEASKTTSSKRTTTPTTRRTSTSRTSSNRTGTMNRTSRTSTGDRNVRALTTSEVTFSPMEVDQRSTELQSRIVRIPNLSPVSNRIGVKVDGNSVTLSGNVPTTHERKIAEQLVRLEPGVDSVRNQLVVTPKQ